MGRALKKLRIVFCAIEADISTLDVEAIVNAANEPLIMGGGVDGAIRRKAGPDMETELRQIGRCPTGQAIITAGHSLPARHVIHTVAPIWSGDAEKHKRDVSLLGDCYRNVLTLAHAHAIHEIAFPCLGTGIYGWPPDLAARTAFDTVKVFLQSENQFSQIVFCCFNNADKVRYASLIGAFGQE